MRPPTSGDNALARLQAVQTCVRELARKHPWLVDEIRTAFDDFQILRDRFMAEKAAMRDKECRLAREQLAKGWLCDPEAGDNNSCLFVRVEGLCPVALADRLGKHGEAAMPEALERESAAAALAALDRDSIYQAVDLPEGKRDEMAAEYRAALDAKTHVELGWRVTLRKPLDWREPADPHALALVPIVLRPTPTGDLRADVLALAAWKSNGGDDDGATVDSGLSRFSSRDSLTIALYRLGGLANAQSVDPSRFPPDIAEQMLLDVEGWVTIMVEAWDLRLHTLLNTFVVFRRTLTATTVPAEGEGRRVVGVPHALALSEATSTLHGELSATIQLLIERHGRPSAGCPAGLVPMESDSPDGPWTPIPASAIKGMTMRVGGKGADAILLAALDNATKVTAFLIDKWNAMQAARPGAVHSRFHAGDVVSEDDLALLDSAEQLLRLKVTPAPSLESVRSEHVGHSIPMGVGLTAAPEKESPWTQDPARALVSQGERGDDDAPAATLPPLGPRDREAWQLSLVAGLTQQKIADKMNKEHPGENWTQPRVSEAIKRAKAHAEASGLADKVTATRSRAPARTLDPAAADSGQRTDGRSKHLRERARQIAKEE